MPKKSRIAWKRKRLILSLNKRCIAVLCVLPTFIRCQALYSQLTRVVHPPLTFSSKSFKAWEKNKLIRISSLKDESIINNLPPQKLWQQHRWERFRRRRGHRGWRQHWGRWRWREWWPDRWRRWELQSGGCRWRWCFEDGGRHWREWNLIFTGVTWQCKEWILPRPYIQNHTNHVIDKIT